MLIVLFYYNKFAILLFNFSIVSIIISFSIYIIGELLIKHLKCKLLNKIVFSDIKVAYLIVLPFSLCLLIGYFYTKSWILNNILGLFLC